MKKSIKQSSKTPSASNKKNTRTNSTKQKGYKEEVYDDEEQKNYDKSELAKSGKKNTSGPK